MAQLLASEHHPFAENLIARRDRDLAKQFRSGELFYRVWLVTVRWHTYCP
jgi:hypothetical protein